MAKKPVCSILSMLSCIVIPSIAYVVCEAIAVGEKGGLFIGIASFWSLAAGSIAGLILATVGLMKRETPPWISRATLLMTGSLTALTTPALKGLF